MKKNNSFDIESVMSSTPSCIKIVSSDGLLVHMNRQGLELIEADDLESVIGANVYDLLEESHLENFKSLNKRVCAGESVTMVFEIIGLKGTRRWMESHAAPYILPNGDTAQIAITNDITLIKTKSIIDDLISDLRANYLSNSGNYQEFFNFLLSKIINLTKSEYGFVGEIKNYEGRKYLKTYAITDISWNEETKFFYKENAPTGMEFLNLESLFGEVIKTGKVMLTNKPDEHPKSAGIPYGHPSLDAFLGIPIFNSGEFIAMIGLANRPSGYDLNFYNSLSPLFAAIGEMIAYFQLDKANQEYENKLEELNKYLDIALEVANLGVWDWWLADNSVKFDQRWAQMLGIDFDTIDMKLDTWESRVHPNDIDNCNSDIKSYMNGETALYRNIHRMKHSNGEWIYILDQGKFSAWDENGKPTRFTGTYLDITDQKKQELEIIETRNKALIAEKTKMQFLANMSHEIRTPMNGVLGMADLISDTNLNTAQKEMVDTIKICGEGLMSLLNDILDISKIESGKLNLDIHDFNLTNSIDEIIKLLSFNANEKGIGIHFKNRFEKGFNYLGDETRIKQVLINIISNAIKFTGKGRIDIHIDVPENLDQDGVTIIVKDTGIGISKENQSKLFNEFIQAENSTTRKFGGSGLGLSICQQLATIMSGEIKLESIFGKGSTFYIKLPLKRSLKEITTSNDSKLKTIIKQTLGKVLIVEDNLVNQKVAKMTLKKLGYDSDIANNGIEAIEMIKNTGKNKYHLILMDMQMPEMDGLEATFILLRDYKEQCPPIVAMTANAFSEDKDKCFEAGMVSFLTKPIKAKELKSALEHDFTKK